jgi:hypothetical protein
MRRCRVQERRVEEGMYSMYRTVSRAEEMVRRIVL